MTATIQLREGNMFAQPSDLIIIPCSTGGSITSHVAQELENFDISPPPEAMQLGEVKFEIFRGAANIATYVGYAASVLGMRSNKAAISSISEKTALFAQNKPEIRNITLPLLGSGAGGLSQTESAEALIQGIERVDAADKVYNIFVYRKDDFEALSRHLSRETSSLPRTGRHRSGDHVSRTKRREAVRVFISYTKTDVEHEARVRDLATFLRANGVDARLDIWLLRPGMDLPQWMSNELDLADRVLIICNEDYAKRADGRVGGVGWEIRIVQGDLLQSQQSNPKKYIPIVFDTVRPADLPRFLQGVYAVTWKTDGANNESQGRLLRELYSAYEEAPPLGEPPRFVLR
ncbi:hypothetical protein HNR60_000253 [Rhodopseudomonas rhenobacensis]|uniref:SEFIR domain-containing protein n=1 Tax=Rhodopseudomonas rhenobacensis TaxID=87461 RepID=A0A7W7Z099_9BRAD|nr:TIR domain-containing protein [Rhodopseudomonas rhenobacensis]MBB5045524.1 hypothetical protein [Rhodopseudomonas rhenobacensis]